MIHFLSHWLIPAILIMFIWIGGFTIGNHLTGRTQSDLVFMFGILIILLTTVGCGLMIWAYFLIPLTHHYNS